jgi:hypothetical protein
MPRETRSDPLHTPRSIHELAVAAGPNDVIGAGLHMLRVAWVKWYLAGSDISGGRPMTSEGFDGLCVWVLLPADAGNFYIKNMVSNAFLGYAGENTECSLGHGGDPHDPNYKWTFESDGGEWIIRSVANPGQILEVSGKNWLNVETWYDARQSNQRWLIDQFSPDGTVPGAIIKAVTTLKYVTQQWACYLPDARYGPIEMIDVTTLWTQSRIRTPQHITWTKELFDCDDFALTMKSQVVYDQYLKRGSLQAPHAFGTLWTEDHSTKEGHAENIYISTTYDLLRFEPQNAGIDFSGLKPNVTGRLILF